MNALRTALIFLFLIALLRLMGKRQVGQMEPSEFAVALLIAELAVIPVEDPSRPVRDALVPLGVVFAAERLLSVVSFRSIRLRRLLCGKPVILVENGKPVLRNLRRTRISLDELRSQLRRQGMLELGRVRYAILETDGALAVFPEAQFTPASARDAGVKVRSEELPCTVISEGRLLEENLALSGRDRSWLRQVLRQSGCGVPQILLLTVTPSGQTELIRFCDC